MNNELEQILRFVSELEKLKCVHRQNRTLDSNRWENSAEHSWHVALMAVLFERYFPEEVNLLKVVKMLLIHDVVEIDVGDTFLYDEEAKAQAKQGERQAAERIFGLLPIRQKEEFLGLWQEFECRDTVDAQCAAALDALQPLINHVITQKENQNPYELTKTQITQKKEFIKNISEEIWEVAKTQIDKATERGLYKNE